MSNSHSASQSPQSSQAETKLSQWDALTLESLRSKGWSNEQIIEGVLSGKLPADDSKFQFNYAILTTLAKEQADVFLSAVNDGYRIKFNTIRGIHSWILVALGHEGHLSLEPGEEAVYAALNENEADRLRNVLSFGWQLSSASPQSMQKRAAELANEPATDEGSDKKWYVMKLNQET